jgi:hypothetical protein
MRVTSQGIPKHNNTNLAFMIVYLIVGAILIYLSFTGKIPSSVLAVGMFVLIAVSLVVKFVWDFKKRRKLL